MLANAFIDLGAWDCFTPFVGAGVGGTYNTLAEFHRHRSFARGLRHEQRSERMHLAWALYAGLSYQVTKGLSIDLTYRYLNLGSITGDINCFGVCHADS